MTIGRAEPIPCFRYKASINVIKKIDQLVLRSFVGPFVVVFGVALIVLMLQFLWKYVDDLVGKGLDLATMLELMFYLSASLVPMALPLAMLIGSIIAFGNLGEHYELVALKSAGISLQRFMMPLLVISMLLGGLTFIFMDRALPLANLKFRSILYSIVKKKPALNIQEGIFYEGIDGYTIRVGEKADDNRSIYDVIIWDNTRKASNTSNVLTATRGDMTVTADEKFLVFRLFEGWQFEELKEKAEQGEAAKEPHMRTYFDEYEMVLDLSSFGMREANEDIYKTRPKMLSIDNLQLAIDSLEEREAAIPARLVNQLKPYFTPMRDSTFAALTVDSLRPDSWLDDLALSSRFLNKSFQYATDDVRGVGKQLNWSVTQRKNSERKIVRYYIAWYEKYATALSCVLLYLVGAAMGAIIRKGGIGLPMVVGIIFFMLYYVFTTTGRKMAEEGAISAFNGMFLAIYLLTPLAVYLLYHAINDSPVVSTERFKRLVNWSKRRLAKKAKTPQAA